MAPPATSVYEIRPTNGNANNGGGFVPGGSGIDRSQQDAAHVIFDGSTIAGTTPGVSATITITGYTVTADDVNNFLCITGGANFSVGIFHIASVNVGANTWTLDRNVSGAAASGLVARMGGARTGFTTGSTALGATLAGGAKVWVKNEAWNEAAVINSSGADGSWIDVEGYNTARGDLADPANWANRPTNDRATAGAIGFNISGLRVVLKYLRVRRAGTVGFQPAGQLDICIGCRADSNGSLGFSATLAVLLACEADSNTTHGFAPGTETLCIGCYSHDNTQRGFDLLGEGIALLNCISEANAGHGIAVGNVRTRIINCTVNGNPGALIDGINYGTPPVSSILINTIMSNNGRYGANATDGDSLWTDNNNYFGNGTAARNNVPAGANDRALDPQFVDAAGGNFAIGTNLKGLGWPGLFPGGLSTGGMDIGAVQRVEAAAGGLVRANISGGLV